MCVKCEKKKERGMYTLKLKTAYRNFIHVL